MGDVTIKDPDAHRMNRPVQKDGTVSVGREFAGKRVNVVVEVVGDDDE